MSEQLYKVLDGEGSVSIITDRDREKEGRKPTEGAGEGDYLCVGLYLFAIVAANLSVARFGPAATVVNAFLFIGLDLTSRDKLHEAWSGKYLWVKMAGLIAIGSFLSWALNHNVGRIALASLVSFAVAGVVDALAFHVLRERVRLVRVNGSNVVSALVDSIAFPTIAFGAFMPLVVLGQFGAKILGGLLWSLVLWRRGGWRG